MSRVTRVPMSTSRFARLSVSSFKKAVAALLRTPCPIVDCNQPSS